MQAFEDTYKREFGFVLEKRSIIVDDLRVRATGKVCKYPLHRMLLHWRSLLRCFIGHATLPSSFVYVMVHQIQSII